MRYDVYAEAAMLDCKDHGLGVASWNRVPPSSDLLEHGAGDETQLTLDELAKRIHRHKAVLQPDPEKRTEAIFALGRALCAAKPKLSHGQFRVWLKTEFGWPERAAQRYMRVARVLGGKSDIVSDLTFTTLIALSAKTTNDKLRESILAALDSEEPISNQEVMIRIKDAQSAEPSKTLEKAQAAANFLCEKLPREAVPLLAALLDGADAKEFVAALRDNVPADVIFRSKTTVLELVVE